jgi:hypothetical protein
MSSAAFLDTAILLAMSVGVGGDCDEDALTLALAMVVVDANSIVSGRLVSSRGSSTKARSNLLWW